MFDFSMTIKIPTPEMTVMWLCVVIVTAIIYALSKKRDVLMLGVSSVVISVITIIKSLGNMSQFVTFLIVYIILRLVFSESENNKPVYISKNTKNVKNVSVDNDENSEDCCSDDL